MTRTSIFVAAVAFATLTILVAFAFQPSLAQAPSSGWFTTRRYSGGTMAKEPKDKPTQQTQPRGEGPPIEIPVPKRNDVLGALRKVARPGSTRRRGRPKK